MAEKGLSSLDIAKRLAVYGRNIIDINLKPLHVLLFREVLSPFYIFQLFRCVFYLNFSHVLYYCKNFHFLILIFYIDIHIMLTL